MTTLHHRTCHLCEAMCGLRIEVDEGDITSIRGDNDDPLSRGHICPKAVALKDLHTDPDRLRGPVRRTGPVDDPRWTQMTWDEAFDRVAVGIREVQQAHGRDAVAVYQGNPSVHNLGTILHAPQFVRSLGTRSRFSATSADQLPHQFMSWAMYGHQLLLPIPDIDRTHFLLMLGTNPAASNGSIMTVPDVRKRTADISERGGRVVLIDPRRTETAGFVDEHVFIRPGTDALLLAAMVHTLFEHDWVDLGRLAAFTDGVDAVREAVAPFTPGKVAAITRVDAAVITRLARELSHAESGVVHGRFGVSTQEFGGLCQWLCQVLNALTGNLDKVGGTLFTRPAVTVLDRLSPGRHARWHSRVRGLPEFSGELPVSVMAEEINTQGEGQIKALVTSAGNPVLSTPNGAALDEALTGLDFMVSVDPYINETTRHAHIILPPCSPLERDHYDVVFNSLAVRNVARYSPPIFEKPPTARHDWEIFSELERRLGDPGAKARMDRAVRRRLGTRGLLDLGLRTGPYGQGFKPWGDGLSLSKLEKHPSGVDLGALEPSLPQGLHHTDKRVRLAPNVAMADVPRLVQRLSQGVRTDEGLVLIGRRELRSCNSWMHNSERLVRGKERCTLMIHPEDALALGLEDGQAVRIESRVGVVQAPVALTDQVMPGVVSLPHGWGHGRKGTRMAVANAHAGVSINDLTDPSEVDGMTGNAVLSGVPVTVTAASATRRP